MTSKKQKKKGQSGDPRKVKRPTAANRWNANIQHELTLPSGNVCLVKRPGLLELLGADIFTDDMISLVSKEIANAKLRMEGKPIVDGNPEEEVDEIMNDPKRVAQMFEMFDRTLVYAVVEPRVEYHKDDAGNVIPWEDRNPDAVYTDQVLDTDKTFIFQYVSGGSSDLNRFRQATGFAMADVSDGQGVQADPELHFED